MLEIKIEKKLEKQKLEKSKSSEEPTVLKQMKNPSDGSVEVAEVAGTKVGEKQVPSSIAGKNKYI